MSSSEASKKRGRPKKVVEDLVETAVDVKKNSTRKASTKAAKTAKEEGKVEKATKSTKSSTAKGAKNAGGRAKAQEVKSTVAEAAKSEKEEARGATRSTKQAIPITSSSSKILQEVAAKGTLRAGNSSTTKSAPSQTQPQSSLPSKPPPPAVPSTTSPTTQASPAKSTPKIPASPTPATPSLKFTPPITRARATTVPIPTRPLNPQTPPTTTTAAPKPPPYKSTLPPPPEPSTLPNMTPEYLEGGKLPPKYRSAGRRVSAIIVGVPIIVVTSYELYQRFFLGKDMSQMYASLREQREELTKNLPSFSMSEPSTTEALAPVSPPTPESPPESGVEKSS
ncbi:uncharacterized protein BDR25DRAFT_339563 [Lindgomyces ingoldianus]|uniref:Uncharacterized protein n=1 Tax=Lindgomyces ingoldianus TaxID=673940 RepID=A0ACB6RBE7_9PLEO|nr:uncharacterized protein BDR25DRAFT_339563 [Lindgomyces ingoldianus]KAF2476594.1 hypothetical protein BDR25DRAFT_339563 [Lindgomyces ingoldianus]